MLPPTEEAYGELQTAYQFWNEVLFDSALPPCLITFQRKTRTYGYFSGQRFVNGKNETTDEIALNPVFFGSTPISEVMQTLVHEMTHLWQFHFGKPGRRCYHNKEWASKIEELGLMPSSTGFPGGKKVGEKMAEYILPGGLFEDKLKCLLSTDFSITWRDRFPPDTTKLENPGEEKESLESRSNRRKYSCPKCSLNAWAKPKSRLICGECQNQLEDVGT